MKKLFLVIFAAFVFVACGNQAPKTEVVEEPTQTEEVVVADEVVEAPEIEVEQPAAPAGKPATKPAAKPEVKKEEAPAAETPAPAEEPKKEENRNTVKGRR